MDLDLTNAGKVKVSMVKYLEGVIKFLPEAISGNSSRPPESHLFDLHEDFPLLEEAKAMTFYNCDEKLLL